VNQFLFLFFDFIAFTWCWRGIVAFVCITFCFFCSSSDCSSF